MSAVGGIFGSDTPPERTVREMLGAMRSRGDVASVAVANGVALGAAHFDWEPYLQEWPGGTIADDGECIVVADATLYHRTDLRRKLRSHAIVLGGSTAADLILAGSSGAYLPVAVAV